MAVDPNAAKACAESEQEQEVEIDCSEESRKALLKDILKNKHMCEESRKILLDPHVVFIIRRSKNQNVVVYKANMKNGQIDADNPISVFWLKIEPSYIEKNRKNGKKDDRTELTFLENNMAYGIWQEKTEKNNEYKITFVALKSRPTILKLNHEGLPRCFGKIGDIDAYLVSMYCQTVENWIGLPTVEYVLMTGSRSDNHKPIEDKVTPKDL